MFVITDNGSLQQVLVFADNGSLQHVLVFSSSFFLFLLLISVVIALSLFASCLPFFVLQSGIMHTFVLEELEQAEWPLLEFIKLKFVKEVIVVVLFLRESCCCVENLDCSPLANTEHQVSTERSSHVDTETAERRSRCNWQAKTALITSSNAAPRPQRPQGLLGTLFPGRPQRLSHAAPVL